MYTQRNNEIERADYNTSFTSDKNIKNCSTCKYENSDYQCTHPKSNTKKFSYLPTEKCWVSNGRKATAQKMVQKSINRNTYEA